MRRLSFMVLGFVCLISHAFSANAFVSEEVGNELRKKGKIQNTFYKESCLPTLTPATPLSQMLRDNFLKRENPTFVCESLYLVKKADFSRSSVALRSFSALKNLQYYSHSKKKMRTLYSDCYAVDEKNRPLPDPVEGGCNGKVFKVMMNDSTFGKHFYEYKFYENEGEVAFESKNTDSFFLTVVKVLGAEKMTVSLSAVDMGDGVLLYVLFGVDFFATKAIENTLTASFLARINVLYDWFERQIK